MNDDIAIKVSHVDKSFKLPHEQFNSLKGRVVNFYKRGYEVQEALKDISFEVKKGEFFGILGRNGSGKSTLLKIISGIYRPNSGTVDVSGKLIPFIELGVGFNPELSGRDNVFLNGALLGFDRKQIEAMYDDIVTFAELGRFMDQKLKNYSSGMQVRLAFSIAIRADADILVLDEVLAVGDAAFQQKCFEYFHSLKARNKTVIFISHDMESIRRFCDRALIINEGIVDQEGNVQDVVGRYLEIMGYKGSTDPDAAVSAPRTLDPSVARDHGFIKLTGSRLEDASGMEVDYLPSGSKTFSITMTYEALKDTVAPVPSVALFNQDDHRVLVSNTKWNNFTLKDLKKGETQSLRFEFDNFLETGNYEVSLNIVSADLTTFYDWNNNALKFYCERGYMTGGIANIPARVSYVEA